MKKIFPLVLIAIMFVTTSFKPVGGILGTVFPTMECEDYNGTKVKLPTDAKGNYTLICMAFSTAAEDDLKTWVQPIYNKFLGEVDTTKADMFNVGERHNINLYFVPMFTGFNQLTSKQSKEKIKSRTDKELYPYLLFYDGGKTYKDELEFKERDIPYFFVLDANGTIMYTTSGKYDDKKLERIIDVIEE